MAKFAFTLLLILSVSSLGLVSAVESDFLGK